MSIATEQVSCKPPLSSISSSRPSKLSSHCPCNHPAVFVCERNDDAVFCLQQGKLSEAMTLFSDALHQLREIFKKEGQQEVSTTQTETCCTENQEMEAPCCYATQKQDNIVRATNSYTSVELGTCAKQEEYGNGFYNRAFPIICVDSSSSCWTMSTRDEHEIGAVLIFNFALCCHKLGLETGKASHLVSAYKLYMRSVDLLVRFDDDAGSRSTVCNVIKGTACYNLYCIYCTLYTDRDAIIMYQCFLQVFDWINEQLRQRQRRQGEDTGHNCNAEEHRVNDDDVAFFHSAVLFSKIIHTQKLAPAA